MQARLYAAILGFRIQTNKAEKSLHRFPFERTSGSFPRFLPSMPSPQSTSKSVSKKCFCGSACNRSTSAFFVFAFSLIFTACVTPPREPGIAYSPPLAIRNDTQLANAIDPLVEAHPGETGFYLLSDGLDALQARIAAIEAAQQSIDVQCYIFENDLTGRLFMNRLLAAADRGVRVRLLIDDLAKGWKDRYLAFAAAHPKVEIRLFNPPVRIGSLRPLKAAARFRRIHRRMHNKEFIVDGKFSIVGGRNIGDEYFEASERDVIDLDTIVIGQAVQDLNRFFNDYWNYALSVPVELVALKKRVSQEERHAFRAQLDEWIRNPKTLAYLERLKANPLFANLRSEQIPFSWGKANAYADKPEKLSYSRYRDHTHLTPAIAPYISFAEKELILISPYFIPGKRGSKSLGELSEKGVDVVVITNSLDSNNHPLVHAAYMKYRKRLLASGVQLHETKAMTASGESDPKFKDFSLNTLLHTKLFLVDQRYVMIGSLNLDPRSRLLNTELMIVLDSPELAKDIVNRVKANVEERYWKLELSENEQVHWTDLSGPNDKRAKVEPGTGWFERQKLRLLSLLPFGDQL